MRKALVSLMLTLLLGTSAGAICQNPAPRLLCAEYFQSDAVVTAKLLRIRHVTVSDDDDYLLYTMQTDRVLRGKLPALFRVIDSTGSGRTGINWGKGQSYLLFLRYQKDYKAWSLDSCGNSGPLAESAEALKGIDQLQGHHEGSNDGMIQGLVWLDPGATVLVHGMHHTFKTTANEKGEFEVHVPAGQYSVSVVHDAKRFEPDDLSYEDPKRLRVPNGGCAQVQFNLSEQK